MTKLDKVRAAGRAAIRGRGVTMLTIVPANGRYKYTAKFLYQHYMHTVHFGHKQYEDYHDHKDAERQRRYLARSLRIRDSRGMLTCDNPVSPNFWSLRTLWAYSPHK